MALCDLEYKLVDAWWDNTVIFKGIDRKLANLVFSSRTPPLATSRERGRALCGVILRGVCEMALCNLGYSIYSVRLLCTFVFKGIGRKLANLTFPSLIPPRATSRERKSIVCVLILRAECEVALWNFDGSLYDVCLANMLNFSRIHWILANLIFASLIHHYGQQVASAGWQERRGWGRVRSSDGTVECSGKGRWFIKDYALLLC